MPARPFAVLIGAIALAGACAAVSTYAITYAVPAAAAPDATTCTGTSGASSVMDIDGNSSSDIAVGVPAATTSGRAGAGAVDINYGNGEGHVQHFGESLFSGLPAPAAGDAFGTSLTFTSLDGNQCRDLAIGAPGANGGRGAVIIARGSDAGVASADAVRLTGTTAGEHFGSKVVARGDDLWISAPDRSVDGAKGAGAVDHYRLDGGVATLVQTLTEDVHGVPGKAEAGDGFGRELDVSATGPLIVGEPGEDIGSHAVDAGTIAVLYDNPSTGRLSRGFGFSQDSAGIPGTAETGDHFGTSVSSDEYAGDGTVSTDVRIAVGVPGESLGRLAGAGTVDVFVVQPESVNVRDAFALSQNSADVPGTDEAGDRFGKKVLFDDDGLCIGVPGEDIGRAADTGRVLCDERQFHTGWETFQEGTGGIGGTPHSNAAFGSDLGRYSYWTVDASSDRDPQHGGEDLLTAVPGANVAGVPASGQIRSEEDYAFRDSSGAVAHERYGVLAFTPTQGPIVR